MNKFGKLSIIASGLMLPLALIAGNLVTWYYKSGNPDNVDITAGLAYLRPILVISFTIFALTWLISLVSGLMALRRDRSSELGRIGLLLLALVSIISLFSAIAANKVTKIEENYKEQQSLESSAL